MKTINNVVSILELVSKLYSESTIDDLIAVVGGRMWFWDEEIPEILDKVFIVSYQRLDRELRELEVRERKLKEAIEKGFIDESLIKELEEAGYEIEIADEAA